MFKLKVLGTLATVVCLDALLPNVSLMHRLNADHLNAHHLNVGCAVGWLQPHLCVGLTA